MDGSGIRNGSQQGVQKYYFLPKETGELDPF
jgi:hypothetical protein